ncbi:hypothetical protein SDC9_111657 [bioreactor metagenome]|uniref:Uncharacterized protein n=1 Tax=bioreactor metagenome TaxID=1076179 RepID=A0A645BI53_9ZZZZ
MLRFLFNADGFTRSIKIYHTIAFRVTHFVGKDQGAISKGSALAQLTAKPLPKENVIAQNQGHFFASNELLTHNKSICQAARFILASVGELKPKLRSIPKQPLKTGQVFWRADHQNIADACQHKHGKRVIDHRFIVNRQQLLAGCQSEWV